MPEFLKKRGRRFYLNVLGAVIVASWLIMLGMLVKRNQAGRAVPVSNAQYPVAKIDSSLHEWKEIYLKGRKVGYAVNLIKPFQGGYFIQEEIFLKLNLMGLGGGVYTVTRSRTNEDFLLQNFQFAMTSGAVSFKLSGEVKDATLTIRTGKGRDLRTQSIKLTRRPMLGAGMSAFFKSRRLSVGETFSLPIFDPSSMAQREVDIKVADKEKVNIRGVVYDAFRLEAEMWGNRLNFWVDEKGATLKEEGFMGLTMVKSSPARAPRDLEREGDVDIYDLTSVSVDRTLPHPKRLAYLKVRLEGIDPTASNLEALNNARQQFHQGVMTIKRESPPFQENYSLPHDDFNEGLQVFVGSEFNIESDHEAIIEQARKIAGNRESPLAVARALMTWVYRTLEKSPVVSVPSALEVLKTRVGDCNEHATLLTALLRASGIPAKICIGLVYTREKFYYHAWVEAYVGTWISMDATLDQMPADATHIKLLEGNLDKQVEIAEYIGKMSIAIMEFKR